MCSFGIIHGFIDGAWLLLLVLQSSVLSMLPYDSLISQLHFALATDAIGTHNVMCNNSMSVHRIWVKLLCKV